MRKAASILSILFGVAVLWVSTSKSAMEQMVKWHDSAPPGAWWGSRPWGGPDLVRMAYLGTVPKFQDSSNAHHFIRAHKGTGRIDLYVYGDSYVKDIPDSVFYGLNAYHFARRDYGDLSYTLDKGHINILVLEMAERFIRTKLNRKENFYEHIYPNKPDSTTPASFEWHPPEAAPGGHLAGLRLPSFIEKDFFNPAINQNIEYTLFAINAFTPIRSFKAKMTALLFRRGSGDVVISEDGSRLFLRSTVAPKGNASAYQPISISERDSLITQVNAIYAHYKAEGFEEVYLSLPPNPASVIQPEGYNQLVPILQQATVEGRIHMPVIDIYDVITASHDPGSYYLRGDTHWNDRAMQLWISKVNTLLRAWEAAPRQARGRRKW